MQIEKTTLIEFDENRERQRILKSFKGQEQKALLTVLDDVVAGRWDVAMEAVRNFSRDMREYLHPVIFEVLREVNQTFALKQASAAEPKPKRDFDQLLDFGGIPQGGDRLEYPKFQIRGTGGQQG